nr:hypothetical protein [bacterium]
MQRRRFAAIVFLSILFAFSASDAWAFKGNPAKGSDLETQADEISDLRKEIEEIKRKAKEDEGLSGYDQGF